MKNLMFMLVPALFSFVTFVQNPEFDRDWLPDVQELNTEESGAGLESSQAGLVDLEVPEAIPEDSIPHLTRDDLQCIDENISQLASQLADQPAALQAHSAVIDQLSARIDNQASIIGNLTEQVANDLSAAVKLIESERCACNCPTAEEIADAVESRLKPLLVVQNTTTKETREIPVSQGGTFSLQPGEQFLGYKRMPNGDLQPVIRRGAVNVQSVQGPVQSYSVDGWEIRTHQKSTGPIVGQVQKTCRQVWNSVTRRWENRCN